MSEKVGMIDKEKLAPIYALQRERRLVTKELETKGSLTIPEISRATGLPSEIVFRHMVALRQSGRVEITGEKEGFATFGLIKK